MAHYALVTLVVKDQAKLADYLKVGGPAVMKHEAKPSPAARKHKRFKPRTAKQKAWCSNSHLPITSPRGWMILNWLMCMPCAMKQQIPQFSHCQASLSA